MSQLSPLTTSHDIAIQFRPFGEIAELRLEVDPANGSSLGLCRIVFRKNESSKAAVAKMAGAKIGPAFVKVETDDGKVSEQKIRDILTEREEARALAAFAAKSRVEPRKAPPKPEPPKYKNVYRRDETKISTSASETTRRLGNSAYIFISGKVLPLYKVTPTELQIHFSGKKNKDIFTDSYGFYVTFTDDAIAAHAHKSMDRSTFLGYRLHMELHKAKVLEDKPMKGSFKKSFQPVDPAMETANKLVKELQEVFMRDLRSRIAGPALLDSLDPVNFGRQPERKKMDVVENVDLPKGRKLADVLSNIPRFKKKDAQVNHRMDHHAMYSDASDSDDESRSDRPSSVVPSERSEVERTDNERKDRRRRVIEEVMDESSASEVEMEVEKEVEKEIKPAVVVDEAEAKVVSESDSDEQIEIDEKPEAVHEEDDIVLDLDGIQSIVKDDEDLELLRIALGDTQPADIKDVSLWAWRQKEAKAAHTDGTKGVVRYTKETGWTKVNATGSARTEGYYAIPDIEKSLYLPNRNRAIVTQSANSSSRMNRANNRRQAAGFEAQRQTLEASDLLRFNSLKSRKKQLKFSRSAIHDWGLYALEHIERGDMVIEYVGEIIRQQVADHREKRYERQGIGSSYLFRIDEDTVIDATKSGNIARFINHSCDPSCTAKIIQIYNQKKIVIYALKDIAVGEEVTYDYKFEKEDEDKKIPCLCGSAICRRTLN